MPNIRWLLALITAVHRFVYRISGGRIGARLQGHPMLLLDNLGRKSGQLRQTPLLYVPDGTRWLVIASNAGDDRPPAWFLNLRAHPETRIQVGPERVEVCASFPEGEQRQKLWDQAVAAYPPYADYEKRTERVIPVVVLERRGS